MPNELERMLNAITEEYKARRRKDEEYRIERAEEENRYRNIAIDEDLEELRW